MKDREGKMKTAFVATVGIGTGPEADIVPPLAKSIRDANPTLLWLVATKESRENAQRILKGLDRDEGNSRISELSSKENVSTIFKEVSEILSDLVKQGFSPKNITVDYTTGTKAMSAGAVLAAVKYRCENLKYIAVRRDEERRVIPETEERLTIGPAEILASYNIDLAVRLIKEFRFDSALKLLSEINEAHLTEREKDVWRSLKYVATAYDKWDKFEHTRFHGEYGKISFLEPALKEFKLEKGVEREVLEIGKNLREGRITESAIADLVNNAERRIKEGKFDDATARLYRTIEMLGQWRLKKYGIEHFNVDLSKVPESLREEYQSHRDPKNGKIKIGLQPSYKLLKAKSDELGEEFYKNTTLTALLRGRNESILAHGTKPILRESCEKLLIESIKLAAKFIENFDELLGRLKFPWE